MTLENKTILITGAARRLGKAIALACAQSGADIILHYHTSEQEAEETCQAIKALGRRCWLIQTDLADSSAVESLIPRAVAFSDIYALVNNASIFHPIKFGETTLADWDEHMRVNLTAPFILTQAFARCYTLPFTGRVVNLVDWRALRPGRDHFPYTISKAALVALTQATALNLAPRINVNAIALGAILPPENQAEYPNLLKNIPAMRWATIDELIQSALFLLDGPEYITGEIIHLDGGRHLV